MLWEVNENILTMHEKIVIFRRERTVIKFLKGNSRTKKIIFKIIM